MRFNSIAFNLLAFIVDAFLATTIGVLVEAYYEFPSLNEPSAFSQQP